MCFFFMAIICLFQHVFANDVVFSRQFFRRYADEGACMQKMSVQSGHQGIFFYGPTSRGIHEAVNENGDVSYTRCKDPKNRTCLKIKTCTILNKEVDCVILRPCTLKSEIGSRINVGTFFKTAPENTCVIPSLDASTSNQGFAFRGKKVKGLRWVYQSGQYSFQSCFDKENRSCFKVFRCTVPTGTSLADRIEMGCTSFTPCAKMKRFNPPSLTSFEASFNSSCLMQESSSYGYTFKRNKRFGFSVIELGDGQLRFERCADKKYRTCIKPFQCEIEMKVSIIHVPSIPTQCFRYSRCSISSSTTTTTLSTTPSTTPFTTPFTTTTTPFTTTTTPSTTTTTPSTTTTTPSTTTTTPSTTTTTPSTTTTTPSTTTTTPSTTTTTPFTTTTLAADLQEIRQQVLEKNSLYYKHAIHPITGFVYDSLTINVIGSQLATYTKIPNIALQIHFLTAIAMNSDTVSWLSPSDACEQLKKIVASLHRMDKWNGFFYDDYWLNNGADAQKRPDRSIVSTLENGEMSLALAGMVGGLKSLHNFDQSTMLMQLVDSGEVLINAQDYRLFYDSSRQLLRATQPGASENYYLDRVSAEGRAAVLWAILFSSVPEAAWFNMGRPTREYVTQSNQVYQVLATWDGAAFQELWANIYFDEITLSPKGLGQSHVNFLEISKDYANKMSYPAFISTATDPFGGYSVTGIAQIAESSYAADKGYWTPHATALCYMIDPEFTLRQLNSLQSNPDYSNIVGPFGLFDSGRLGNIAASRYLALDQGLLIVSLMSKTVRESLEFYFDSNQMNQLQNILKNENYSL